MASNVWAVQDGHGGIDHMCVLQKNDPPKTMPTDSVQLVVISAGREAKVEQVPRLHRQHSGLSEL